MIISYPNMLELLSAICDVHAVALSNSNLCKFEFAAHSTMSDMEPLVRKF